MHGADLHHGPADETNDDHHEPARNSSESIHHVAQGHVEAEPRQPPIERVQSTVIGSHLRVGLFRMNLIDGLRSDGRVVQIDDMQGNSRPLLTNLHLWELEVPHTGRGSGPDSAEDSFFLAIQNGELRRRRIHGKQGHGLLHGEREREI